MGELLDLPNEVILIIFSFIPSRDLWQNVRATCRHLSRLLADQKYWKFKLQLARRLGKRQRVHSVHLSEYDLTASASFLSFNCAKVEEERERWSDNSLHRFVITTGHDGSVDAVALMQSSSHKRLCISGARDRALVVWDIDVMENEAVEEKWKVYEVLDSHQGWIWSLCKADNDTFFSSGWDRFVKQWRIVDDHVKVSTYHSVSCITLMRILQIYMYEAKKYKEGFKTFFFGSWLILNFANPGSNYLYSSGADGRIVRVDKRMWKTVSEMQLRTSYSRSLSLLEGQLSCGTADGKILSLDPESLEILNV
ncbi:unnamed protein product [Gongylonema pulchrum]|uniref:F-box domain-containing protein n=1 Tax=Gongylonema pulchrum TaxID=637853 RepID=A0A183DZV6_9BILA|nr:unnamed protein product [Gongylonema pulchrum]